MLTPPPPIRTDASNAFAHNTMSRRIPAILRETSALNPDYEPLIHASLERLAQALEADAPIPMLALPTSDYAGWAAARDAHTGESWQHSEWFFAETFLYRHLIEATRWFENGRDPFAPKKAEEFASDALWHTLEEALTARTLAPEERLGALIEFDLWGNRIDLSHAVSAAHGAKAGAEDLLVNDTPQVVEHLFRTAGGRVHLVCDNCGTELAMDCALVDALLEDGHEVWMHVKAHPFFVSDTLVADVHHFWRLLAARGGEAALLAARLQTAYDGGRLRLLPDYFWCSSHFLPQLPAYLRTTFASATLVILKGDLNFRRAVSDTIWQPTTPFADIVQFFPAPLLALRTLKSDAVVGLAVGEAERIAATDPHWRVNGKRGVIQSNLRVNSASE
jgi:uncharacterized protein with ATP-grasp and redox domains